MKTTMTHTAIIKIDMSTWNYEEIAAYQQYLRRMLNDLDYDVEISMIYEEHTPAPKDEQ